MLQIWLMANEPDAEPRYATHDLSPAEKDGKDAEFLLFVMSPLER